MVTRRLVSCPTAQLSGAYERSKPGVEELSKEEQIARKKAEKLKLLQDNIAAGKASLSNLRKERNTPNDKILSVPPDEDIAKDPVVIEPGVMAKEPEVIAKEPEVVAMEESSAAAEDSLGFMAFSTRLEDLIRQRKTEETWNAGQSFPQDAGIAAENLPQDAEILQQRKAEETWNAGQIFPQDAGIAIEISPQDVLKIVSASISQDEGQVLWYSEASPTTKRYQIHPVIWLVRPRRRRARWRQLQ